MTTTQTLDARRQFGASETGATPEASTPVLLTPGPLTVGIVGSRDYPEEERVRAYVRSLPPGTTVVSGGRKSDKWQSFVGRGVDVWAADEAEKCGLDVIEHEPDRSFGIPACFHIRNGQIVGSVYSAIERGGFGWLAAFSKEPITPGTRSSIRIAQRYGVPVEIEP